MMIQRPIQTQGNRSDTRLPVPSLAATTRINFSEEEQGLLKEMFRNKRDRDDRSGDDYNVVGEGGTERPSKVSRADPSALADLSPKGGADNASKAGKFDPFSTLDKSSIGGGAMGLGGGLGLGVGSRGTCTYHLAVKSVRWLLRKILLSRFSSSRCHGRWSIPTECSSWRRRVELARNARWCFAFARSIIGNGRTSVTGFQCCNRSCFY